MNKVTFDDFKEKLMSVTEFMEVEDKLDLFEELLETGSVSLKNSTFEKTFSIIDGLSYEEKPKYICNCCGYDFNEEYNVEVFLNTGLCRNCYFGSKSVSILYLRYDKEGAEGVQLKDKICIAGDFENAELAQVYIQGYADALGLETAFVYADQEFPLKSMRFNIEVNNHVLSFIEFNYEGEI